MMRRSIAIILSGAVLAIASPTAAADRAVEARLSPAYGRCLKAPAGMTDPGMRDCVGAEIDIQDKALNAAYRAYRALLTEPQQADLLAAQRAWIAFRDADCGSLYQDEWGTASRLEAMSCMLNMTVERTIELEERAERLR